MSYQDVLDKHGNVLKEGTRDCATRWDAIAADLEGLRGFRALDLGAYTGYFSQRLATEFDANVTAVDNYRPLVQAMNGIDGVQVIDRRLSYKDIAKLGGFDVTLALSVLHHMSDWRETLDVLLDNSGRLYIEVPNASETLPKAIAHSAELTETVESLGGEKLAEADGHRSDIKRTLWVIK